MSTVNQRLKYFIEIQGLTHKQVARTLDINDKQFNNWLNNTKPSIDGIEKVCRYFKNLNVRWLITGAGEPIHTNMSEEQRLKTLAELSNAETLLEMKTSLFQLNESITDLRRRLFLSEYGITKEENSILK
jgi:transcriptional regulator with XRE-family HTH domain